MGVGVLVIVNVEVRVGVLVDVMVGVKARTVWGFPLMGSPERMAGKPVVTPAATMEAVLIVFVKVPPAGAFKLIARMRVWGAPGLTIK
jgi:hypothetical protein